MWFCHDNCRSEVAGDDISGRFVRLIVPDNAATFHNRPRKIRPKVVEGGICDSFFCSSCRLEVASVAVDQVGKDVREKFGDFKSNRS